ncbi:MAG TPA: Calx-beta domain-containing protein, partial [Thermoanaerobaculia bacterium]
MQRRLVARRQRLGEAPVARQPGVAVNVSSNARLRGVDGSNTTAWLSATSDALPFFEVVLAEPSTVHRVHLVGARLFSSGHMILAGVFEFFDEADGLLFDSGEITFSNGRADHELLTADVPGVKRVRLTTTVAQTTQAGLTELEVSGTLAARAAVPVTLSKAATVPVSVGFAAADGSAQAGGDFQATTGTLVFAPGVTHLFAEVPLVVDLVEEDLETFAVTLDDAVDAVILDGEATVTVVDDDLWFLSKVFNTEADDLAIPGCVVLTPLLNDAAASMWRQRQVDLAQSFDHSYRLNFGTDEAGGDGMVFALQNGGTSTMGGRLNKQLGYVGGVTPSVGVEIDTRRGSGEPDADHVAVNLDGTITHDGHPAVSARADGADVEDGQDHDLRVVWNAPEQALTVFFDGEPRLVYRADIVAERFAGDSTVFAGLTAATGSRSNVQVACPTDACNSDGGGPLLSVAPVERAEGGAGETIFSFPVTLSCPQDQAVSVGVATLAGTATAGADFVARAETLTFLPGETSKAFAVTVLGDTVPEPTETFAVRLSDPLGAGLRHAEAAGTVFADDLGTELARDRLVEGTGHTYAHVLTVDLIVPPSAPVSLAYATADGTATAGADYLAASGTIAFAAGQQTATVRVDVLGDASIEGEETFFIDLTDASGLVPSARVAVHLVDDDDCPSQNLLVNGSCDLPLAGGEVAGWIEVEGTTWTCTQSTASFERPAYFYSGNLAFATLRQVVDLSGFAAAIDAGTQDFVFLGVIQSFNQSNPDAVRIRLEYLDAGGAVLSLFDTGFQTNRQFWQAHTDQRRAPAGTRAVRVTVDADRNAGSSNDARFDALVDPALTYLVSRQQAGGGLRSLRAAAVTIDDVTVYEGDAGTSDAVFTVNLACSYESEVSMSFASAEAATGAAALAGEDYLPVDGALSFPPGTTAQTIPVPVMGDEDAEPAETFLVELSALTSAGSPVLVRPAGAGTILDDDSCPRSHGYWKNHTGQWPIAWVLMGGVEYEADQMLAFLNAKGGDATLQLALQLVAIKLNLASGSDPSILPVVEAADAFLETYPPGSDPRGAARSEANRIKDELDDFNNSQCGEDDDDDDGGGHSGDDDDDDGGGGGHGGGDDDDDDDGGQGGGGDDDDDDGGGQGGSDDDD